MRVPVCPAWPDTATARPCAGPFVMVPAPGGAWAGTVQGRTESGPDVQWLDSVR